MLGSNKTQIFAFFDAWVERNCTEKSQKELFLRFSEAISEAIAMNNEDMEKQLELIGVLKKSKN